MPYYLNDIYTIRCGKCNAHIGVCPGSQPMPSIYCTECEPAIRDQMAEEEANARAYREAVDRI